MTASGRLMATGNPNLARLGALVLLALAATWCTPDVILLGIPRSTPSALLFGRDPRLAAATTLS